MELTLHLFHRDHVGATRVQRRAVYPEEHAVGSGIVHLPRGACASLVSNDRRVGIVNGNKGKDSKPKPTRRCCNNRLHFAVVGHR